MGEYFTYASYNRSWALCNFLAGLHFLQCGVWPTLHSLSMFISASADRNYNFNDELAMLIEKQNIAFQKALNLSDLKWAFMTFVYGFRFDPYLLNLGGQYTVSFYIWAR